jgi:hypothetical protein
MKACHKPTMPAPRTSIFTMNADLAEIHEKSKQAAKGASSFALWGAKERQNR